MQLPSSVREAILEEIDSYVDAVDNPDAETVAQYVIEQLELAGEDLDLPDIVGDLEDAGALDGPLMEALMEAFETRSEFAFTGEDVVGTFEDLCGIEWD